MQIREEIKAHFTFCEKEIVEAYERSHLKTVFLLTYKHGRARNGKERNE